MFGEVVGALCSPRGTTSAPKRLSSNSNISTSAESEEAVTSVSFPRWFVKVVKVWCLGFEVRYHHSSLEIAGNMTLQLSDRWKQPSNQPKIWLKVQYLFVVITGFINS